MANNKGANTVAYTLTEGQSNNMPPFFNGKNYIYQKERMLVFVQSMDFNIQKIIVNDPQVLTKTSAKEVVIPKEESEWNEEDKKKVELNAKAINMMP